MRPWFSETRRAADAKADLRGAPTLWNRKTIILTVLSVIAGLNLFGFTGMYPTFLREGLHYSPREAGFVASFYGVGALISIGAWMGWAIVCRPGTYLAGAFFGMAALGYLCFHGSGAHAPQAVLTACYGALGSGTIYVNLAGYHVKSVRGALSSRASGMFVTSFYISAAVAGYLMGGIASRANWATAGELQISLLATIAGCLAFALRPQQMAL